MLRFTMEDGGGAFLPTCIRTATGVDLHLAGDAEADAFVRALVAALLPPIHH